MDPNHDRFMRMALGQARRAMAAGEIPIGAVLTVDGEVVARAGNRVERDRDATAHAEILVLRRAMRRRGEKWLPPGSSMYVTLEPCPQCAGAILLARVEHVVFGARNPKAGAFGTVTDFPLTGRFNHLPRVSSGVRGEECGKLLQGFFAPVRKKR